MQPDPSRFFAIFWSALTSVSRPDGGAAVSQRAGVRKRRLGFFIFIMEPIVVHDEKILEQLVHFHVMKLSGGFFLWIGSSPVLSSLALAINSKYDSTPLSALVLGDTSDTTPSSLAQRLKDKETGICKLQFTHDGLKSSAAGGGQNQKGDGDSS
uniref:Proteasome assembly chaperone 4 n=1 Tax=Cyprinus carpio carpio TaxID=630221 RepID=A0A9J8AEH9_CYPCA